MLIVSLTTVITTSACIALALFVLKRYATPR